MMKLSAAVLLMCVAVCACGEFSGITNKKSIEEKNWETDTVLGKILDELRFLRDEDKKNKEENKKNKEEILSLKGQYMAEIKTLKEQYMAEINTLKDEDQKNKEEIKRNKEENKKNKEEIHSLKDEDQKNKEEIKRNKEENKKNKEEIHSLKDEDQKNKEENKKNKDEIHSLKEQYMAEINTLKELNENNMHEINTLKGQTTNSQAAVASAAFMARMDMGNNYPGIGDVIPFNNALLNVGQHYDDQTSVFTCAESGLYLFSVTLYSNIITSGSDYSQMSGALMLDGDKVAEIYSYNGDPDHYQAHQSAVTAVVECPRGGSVWVECQYDGVRIYGTATYPRSLFTGFAITYNLHP